MDGVFLLSDRKGTVTRRTHLMLQGMQHWKISTLSNSYCRSLILASAGLRDAFFSFTQLRSVDFVLHHFKWKCFKRDFFVFGWFDHKKQQRKKKNCFNVHLALGALFWDRLEIRICSLKRRTTRHRARGEPRHVLNESPWTLLENSLLSHTSFNLYSFMHWLPVLNWASKLGIGQLSDYWNCCFFCVCDCP